MRQKRKLNNPGVKDMIFLRVLALYSRSELHLIDITLGSSAMDKH